MIEILKSGLYDTIQDQGRFSVQEFGVPFSGVMDQFSANHANRILGNSLNDAVLEITIVGPKLYFHSDAKIAISGADLSPKLNSEPITMNAIHITHQGDELSFGKRHYGCRAYLAVQGGFQTELVMNSRSMYTSITKKTVVKKGDILPFNQIESNVLSKNAKCSDKCSDLVHEVYDIEVYKGVEFKGLSKSEQTNLFNTTFTVSKDSNRMAYVLNESLPNTIEPIITSLVLPGTVQLTPSGKLMILMRDCQTTGGYPRILQLTEKSINHLSQKIFGSSFRFKCID